MRDLNNTKTSIIRNIIYVYIYGSIEVELGISIVNDVQMIQAREDRGRST